MVSGCIFLNLLKFINFIKSYHFYFYCNPCYGICVNFVWLVEFVFVCVSTLTVQGNSETEYFLRFFTPFEVSDFRNCRAIEFNFLKKCSKFYLHFKNVVRNNLVVEIFPVVVAVVINLYLGENFRPSKSTCQTQVHFFRFYIQSTFASNWGKALSKRQIELLLYRWHLKPLTIDLLFYFSCSRVSE